MQNHDELTSEDQQFCLAKEGEIYAVYVPTGGETSLDLGTSKGAFDVEWFNPRGGGELQAGSVNTVEGPGSVDIGAPLAQDGPDWVALIRRAGK